MVIIKTLAEKIKKRRLLYAQLSFTALAFFMMVILSHGLVSRIVHGNLIKNAETVLTFVQTQLISDLDESNKFLSAFARTVRKMLLRGDSFDALQAYFNDISDHLMYEIRDKTFDGFFGYFEDLTESPIFIESVRWNLPDDFIPVDRPWYFDALAANGNIAQTLIYEDVYTGDILLIYSMVIFDDNRNRIGIIGQRVRIDVIRDRIVETALAQGGYGILYSDSFVLLAHPNREFLGTYIRDPVVPLSQFADALQNGEEISEAPLVSYANEEAIAFFRTLPNKWIIGLVTPSRPYYESVSRMATILSALGLILASVLMGILIRIDRSREKSELQSKHKSVFLANMSHEIRTPMNAIIGMTTIGKSADDIERKDYCFRKIEDASNHLLGVINDILDMSKIEANKFELSPDEFNFEKMLQRVVNVVTFRVDEKNQNLMVYIDKSIPKILIADDQRLAQVITNLLGNAVKFTPENGSIKLEATFLEEKDGLCTIKISVSDTGIGLNPEEQKRVFVSFEQAESSTTRKFGGTGLGLSISKSIVEMMDGKIWVESELGKGATFIFTIKTMRGKGKKQGLLPDNVNWQNIRIMAIDDDPAILEYFKGISQGLGIPCDTALSGTEALKHFEENGHHDIYFVDLKMPGMDGIELSSLLKMRAPADSVVIMISAAEWTSIERDAKKAGVDKFLAKPLFPSDITDAINEALGLKGSQKDESQEDVDISGIFAGRSILLAEDVEINREIVMTLLEPANLNIDCAENGLEAVNKFKESPDKYDMILMDVQMPQMDGYEATRQIRALNTEKAKSIPIVAMTANVFKEDIERCLEAGMNSHIGKPLSFSEVIEKMQTYLR